MRFSSAIAVLLAAEGVKAFSVSKPLLRPAFVRVTESSSKTKTVLKGLLDEINDADSYNLMSSSEEKEVDMNDAYEIFLGELVFSTNDPRVDIMNKYNLASDQAFIDWLDDKILQSGDPDERIALRDLYDIIVDVKKRVELSKLAEEREAAMAAETEEQRLATAEAEADAGRAMSNTDVLRKAQSIDSKQQGAGQAEAVEKKSFYEQELTPEIRMSYESTLKALLPPYKAGDTFETVVAKNYESFDAQFVKVLTERVNNGDEDSNSLLDALATEQSIRMTKATESLRSVLALGEPQRMEGAIVKLAREGGIDESFLLLLEANETQARDAGAMGPAQLMKRLRERAADEKDKQASSKEIRLIRKLLRAEDAPAREAILEDAFTPRENLLVAGTPENARKAVDGEAPDQEKPMPDVPPPDFINACKAVMLNFGNLSYDDDRGDLASRIKQIAAEAEVVATRIYGQGMSVEEQQDRAWKEQTTSIFDLEQMELEAKARGEEAPWANPDGDDDMMLPGFDATGKMKIGGG